MAQAMQQRGFRRIKIATDPHRALYDLGPVCFTGGCNFCVICADNYSINRRSYESRFNGPRYQGFPADRCKVLVWN